jgi:hypothetical protein
MTTHLPIRSGPNWPGLLLAGSIFIFSSLHGMALGQSTPATPPSPPSDVPPQINPLNDGEQAVTNTKKDKVKQVVRSSQNGEQPEIRVTNQIGTYVVKPNQNVGTSLPGDGQSNSNNPVQWVIKSWGGTKDSDSKDEAPPKVQPNSTAPTDK